VAIYFGSNGLVELKRDTMSSGLVTTLDPNDVNVTKRRFSVDFQTSSLITGDQVDIATVDGTALELCDGHSYSGIRRYIHVDEVGGIRLFTSFALALDGKQSDATVLTVPSEGKQIRITTRNNRYRCLANIKDFEITTSRETVDLTNLGDEFKSQFDRGLISGQGSLNCLWQHQYLMCDPNYTTNAPEFPSYLAQLILRMEQGADFKGQFYIYYNGSADSNSIWYEADCLVSNVAVSVQVEGVISTKIDFVTSGPFQLRSGLPQQSLLQDTGDFILQEDGSKLSLEDPN
tara:strand:- start:892 stop:1758 length:867 start_codon:yes stop_codon:yes gene_type:complete